MRAHSVFCNKGAVRTAFAGSEAEARRIRTDWMERFDLKRKDIEVKQVDIPTTKVELLGWLNIQFGVPE